MDWMKLFVAATPSRRLGADIVFIESPESEEELEKVGATIDAPLLANMVPNGRTLSCRQRY